MRSWPRHSVSKARVMTRTSPGGIRAVLFTSMTPLRRRAASAGPGPCTTSPGRRRWRTTSRGETVSFGAAVTRRPLSTASTSVRSTFGGGGGPPPFIAGFDFRSYYVREPRGVLSEIATVSPGFSSDEPKEHLGERLSLPPAFEYLRAQVEANLTPLHNPR